MEVEKKASAPKKYFPFFTVLLCLTELGAQTFMTNQLFLGLQFNYAKRFQIWRYVTVAFVHSCYLHLLCNLALLLPVGIYLERIYGWKRVASVFFGGVILSELMLASFLPRVQYFGIGCSGGVYALCDAYLASVVLNPQHYRWIHFILMGIFYAVGIPLEIYTIDIFGSFSFNEEISFFTHKLGATAGLLIGLSVFPIIQTPERGMVTLKRISCCIVQLLTVVTIVLNLFTTNKPIQRKYLILNRIPLFIAKNLTSSN